jgi:hypothetical protein
MSKFELTSYQVEELRKLFSEIPSNIFYDFIDCLKIYLESGDFDNNLKGDNANRQVHVKKQASLLKDIANQAQKLKTLINGLDKSYTDSIQCEVGDKSFNKIMVHGEVGEMIEGIKIFHKFITCKDQQIKNMFSQYLKEMTSSDLEFKFDDLIEEFEESLFDDLASVSTTDSLGVWIDESIAFSFMLGDDFGNGYLDSFLHAATTNWADFVKLPIKYSESSLFIKYLAILLETSSTEKLSKIAIRSKWLKNNRPLIDFRIGKKFGTVLSESEIAEQSKIADVLYKDQNLLDEKVKIEIDKIKGN